VERTKMKYTERIEQHFAEARFQDLKPMEFRRYLRNRREGDYLIKVSKNSEYSYGADNKYLHMDSFHNGWCSYSRRSQAAWFKKEELKEILDNIGKGFIVVKKSKNGY